MRMAADRAAAQVQQDEEKIRREIIALFVLLSQIALGIMLQAAPDGAFAMRRAIEKKFMPQARARIKALLVAIMADADSLIAETVAIQKESLADLGMPEPEQVDHAGKVLGEKRLKDYIAASLAAGLVALLVGLRKSITMFHATPVLTTKAMDAAREAGTKAAVEAITHYGNFALDAVQVTSASIARTAKPKPKFIYTLGSSASGPCERCAPFGGVVTTGDGKDGVPIPKVHPRCVCTLVEIDAANAGRVARSKIKDQFDWMKSLTRKQLVRVVGKTRADMVFDHGVKIESLYLDNYDLKPLNR